MKHRDPDLRSALDAVRVHDRPDGIDREAMLRTLMQALPPPAKAPASMHHAGWGVAAGVASLVLIASVWRGSSREVLPRRVPAPVVTVSAPPSAPPSAPVVVSTEPAVPVAATERVEPVRAVRTRAPQPTTEPDDEWRMIREAEEALKASQPDRALAILARHATQHRRGVAGPEVLVYRVRAYCMAGRVREAVATADVLRAQAPGSPAAYALRNTCAARGD